MCLIEKGYACFRTNVTIGGMKGKGSHILPVFNALVECSNGAEYYRKSLTVWVMGAD